MTKMKQKLILFHFYIKYFQKSLSFLFTNTIGSDKLFSVTKCVQRGVAMNGPGPESCRLVKDSSGILSRSPRSRSAEITQ